MNEIDLSYELRIFNSIVHYAYNRFHDDNSLKEINVRQQVNQIFKDRLNSWLIQCAIKEGKVIQDRNKENKVIFGGKYLLKKYLKGLIDKNLYKDEKIIPLISQGEKLKKGNRLFYFKLDNQKLILKLSKAKHIDIQLGNIHRKLQNELNILNELCSNKEATVSIKINNDYIWLSYDEKLISNSLKFNNLKENRVLGLDLNPNYIGCSIIEFDSNDKFKIIHKQVFELKQLTNKNISSNKRNYELIKICYHIKNLVNIFKIKKLCIEDLNIKSSNKHLGKRFNRLCNNVWNKNLIINKLNMLANIYGFDFIQVNPAYSSFVGNILYGNKQTPDMIASSIEIARRGNHKYDKNWFYPSLNIEILDEQWKQTLNGVQTWKEWFNKIKNLKVKYRVLLNECDAVFSYFNNKSKVKIYSFI